MFFCDSFVAELPRGELQVLVERGTGGRDSSAEVQGSRVARSTGCGWSTLRPRGTASSLVPQRPTPTSGPCHHLSRWVLHYYMSAIAQIKNKKILLWREKITLTMSRESTEEEATAGVPAARELWEQIALGIYIHHHFSCSMYNCVLILIAARLSIASK